VGKVLSLCSWDVNLAKQLLIVCGISRVNPCDRGSNIVLLIRVQDLYCQNSNDFGLSPVRTSARLCDLFPGATTGS